MDNKHTHTRAKWHKAEGIRWLVFGVLSCPNCTICIREHVFHLFVYSIRQKHKVITTTNFTPQPFLHLPFRSVATFSIFSLPSLPTFPKNNNGYSFYFRGFCVAVVRAPSPAGREKRIHIHKHQRMQEDKIHILFSAVVRSFAPIFLLDTLCSYLSNTYSVTEWIAMWRVVAGCMSCADIGVLSLHMIMNMYVWSICGKWCYGPLYTHIVFDWNCLPCDDTTGCPVWTACACSCAKSLILPEKSSTTHILLNRNRIRVTIAHTEQEQRTSRDVASAQYAADLQCFRWSQSELITFIRANLCRCPKLYALHHSTHSAPHSS